MAEPLSIRFPTRTRLELRAVANLRGTSEGAVVRAALAPHLERELRELDPESGGGARAGGPSDEPEGRDG